MNRIMRILEIIHKRNTVKENEVVLIADHIKPRIAKIGYALKKNNFNVVLLLEKRSKDDLKKTDTAFFSNIYFFDEKEDLYLKCLFFSPLVYHIFTEASVAGWAEYLVQNKNTMGKIVYDQYDIYRGFITDSLDEIGKREKYCLENADGLCCRMFETQHLKHKYHYQFKGKRLLFLDYCWNNADTVSAVTRSKGNMKFVYGGRLLARPITNTERYKIELNGFEHIAKIVQNNNAYFVILPSASCDGSRYSAYHNLKRKYSHLLIKEPMNYKKLIKYERHMDYGIDCVELNEDIEAYCERENAFDIKAKNRYYATNKYFDYLDAGVMPIYGRQGELFGNYLARFGGAVWCSLEEMPDKMNELKIKRDINKKKACRAREIFAIENQIERLITFYKEI